jgi:hypothetical protein
MPNHITNWVEIKGTKAQMAKLKKKVLKPFIAKDGTETPIEVNQSIEFDFNGIIKMPPELNNIVSPCTITLTQKEADKINKDYKKNKWVDKQSIKAITDVEAERRKREYGYVDWYDWAIANWGTKWDAYEAELLFQDDTHLAIKFNTAWSPPTTVFDKLEEMGYTVNCYWEDEDPSNFGEHGDMYSAFNIDKETIVSYRENE